VLGNEKAPAKISPVSATHPCDLKENNVKHSKVPSQCTTLQWERNIHASQVSYAFDSYSDLLGEISSLIFTRGLLHTCNPSIQKAEAEGLSVQGQPGLLSKVQANLGYIARPYLKKIT
jgi:hypothetical protein